MARSRPEEHVDVLRELAADHTPVLAGDVARPWIEPALAEHGALDRFDELAVSSDLRRSKPHPDGTSSAAQWATSQWLSSPTNTTRTT